MTKTRQHLAPLRQTSHINRRVVQTIFRGIDFAEATGRPLNNYAVIHLRENLAVSAADLFTAIRHKFRDWLAYKRKTGQAPLPPLYAYSLENPNDNPHVNWVLHVPTVLQQEFEAKLPVWVERVQGEVRPFDIKLKPVKPNTVKRLAKYIVKGVDPDYADHFYLADLHTPQGTVWGKRAGLSVSLGAAVRRVADFKIGRRATGRMRPSQNDNAKGGKAA